VKRLRSRVAPRRDPRPLHRRDARSNGPGRRPAGQGGVRLADRQPGDQGAGAGPAGERGERAV